MQVTVSLGDPQRSTFSVTGATGELPASVRRACYEFAIKGGWTVPKWWQVWRLDDWWWSWPKDERAALTVPDGAA